MENFRSFADLFGTAEAITRRWFWRVRGVEVKAMHLPVAVPVKAFDVDNHPGGTIDDP